MNCLKVGTRVKFNDNGERGVRDGQVVEIIYIVKRDIKVPGYAGLYGQFSDDILYAVCAQGDTPAAKTERINPLQITQIIRGGISNSCTIL